MHWFIQKPHRAAFLSAGVIALVVALVTICEYVSRTRVVAQCLRGSFAALESSNIKTVIFDLDGTLGPLPGWAQGNVLAYIKRIALIRVLLKRLRAKGVMLALVSKNGMLCSPETFTKARAALLGLGFDHVEYCNRRRPESKTTPFSVSHGPGGGAGCLLIDDQAIECAKANAHGAHAILVTKPVGDSMAKGEPLGELLMPGSSENDET